MRIGLDRTVICLGLGLVLAGSVALRADEPKIEGDLKKLQGEWISKDDTGESTWTFKGDKLTLKTPARSYDIAIKVDGEAKPHKSMDFKVSESSPNAKGYNALGIYKFEGDDKASICFGGAETGRPKEFQGDFQNSFLFELKKK